MSVDQQSSSYMWPIIHYVNFDPPAGQESHYAATYGDSKIKMIINQVAESP